jgi:aminopeptidase N
VIAHELAHQWFGNLVTMKWWDDLWLNESFANFMENFATDSLEPSWNIWQDYESSDIPAALNRDSLDGVQSVREHVENAGEIDSLFDGAIVYAKGGRLIRMVHELVGDEVFRAALGKYFAKFAYKNAEMNDLWNEIWTTFREKNPNFRDKFGADFDLVSMMNDLLIRPGYPVVFADILDSEHYFTNRTSDNSEIFDAAEKLHADGDRGIWLHQRRFARADNRDEKSAQERPFTLPIFANSENAPRILDARASVFREKNPENFQLNMGNNAHFITAYDAKIRENLFANFAKFSDSDRLKLLTEQNILASSTGGFLRESALIPMLENLGNENNYAVFAAASSTFRNFAKILESDEKATKKLKSLALKITELPFTRVKNFAKNTNEKKLHAILLARRIWTDDKTEIRENLELFAKNKEDLVKIDGEIRAITFVNVVKNGDKNAFDFLLETYKNTTDPALKNELAIGLTSTEKPTQIDELIALLTDQNVVRPQDLFFWVSDLLANKFSRKITWKWLRKNWNFIAKTYAGDQSFGEFPRIAAAHLSSADELREFREFFGPMREDPELKRAIELGENEIAVREKWIAQNHDDLAQKL